VSKVSIIDWRCSKITEDLFVDIVSRIRAAGRHGILRTAREISRRKKKNARRKYEEKIDNGTCYRRPVKNEKGLKVELEEVRKLAWENKITTITRSRYYAIGLSPGL